jgi:hypothetical protein
MAPPAPVVPLGTTPEPAAPGAAGAAATDEQFFAPAVLQPVTHLPPDAPPRASMSTRAKVTGAILVVAFVVAAGATAWSTVRPGGTAKAEVPTVLAPRAPSAGLPGNLSVIVRVEAESARRTALQTIEASPNADLSTLASAQPDYQWVAGDQPSSGPKVVSVARSAGTVTIAVEASSHDVCAFGQWSPNASPSYVTMAHVPTCAAVDAPGAGWSAEPGGAGSDLPDDAAG